MLTAQWENVTPGKAKTLLNANRSNRTLRSGIVEKYANDMRAGAWTECIAPIVFYDDGDIADGQHRLWAVVESETTQRFLAVKGLDRKSGLNIDTGLARSLVDNARISGTNEHLSNELISIARAFQIGEKVAPAQLSNADKIALVERWREPCEWAIAHGPKGRGIHMGPVVTAMARAFVHERNHERLAQWGAVMTSGLSEGMNDSAAISFRNWLLSNAGLATTNRYWRQTFLKAQNSIKYFVKGKALTVVKNIESETYPRPE